MNRLILATAIIVVAVLGVGLWWTTQTDDPATGAALQVEVPELSAEARTGQRLFAENCAACHGETAAGTDRGPPLVHRLYEPGHHADYAFLMAARQGVRAHHWHFGDMPPVEGVSDAEISRIVTYVRELQRANGIL